MLSKEIILANINHQPSPRPGMDFTNGRLNDFVYGEFQTGGFSQKRWVEGNIEYYTDCWGNIWKRMVGGSVKGEIFKPAIEDWKDLDELEMPDYTSPDSLTEAQQKFLQQPDKFKLVNVEGWVFDQARYLRNMDVYFMDMGLYPDEVQKLNNRVAAVYEQKIHLAGKIKADGILLAEDLGTQTGLLFSPKMFRFYFKDLYTRLFSIAHEYGMKVFMHSCGKNWAILPDLLDAGVDVFQFDQPTVYDMPALDALLKERKAALFSPIDIQKILPTGDQGLIEQGASEMVEIFYGNLICKNYLDLPGIGVEETWDNWGYQAILRKIKKLNPTLMGLDA